MISQTLSLKTTGDVEVLERLSNRFRTGGQTLMTQIGVFGMGQAVLRLRAQQRSSDVSSGRLMMSISVSASGRGDDNTVFEVDSTSVEVGSNLIYAAQRHAGGRILPRNAKALAIPLIASLARSGIGPSEIDPGRELLSFVPIRGGASGQVFGLLTDPEGALGFGKGKALFALAEFVDQPARPFIFWSEQNQDEIVEDIFFPFLGL